ncbi:MAG: ArsA family ATPase [Candidatus Binatia bacterium]
MVAAASESDGQAAAVSTLFEKRLLFLVGKGGVGKTTVAAALALAAARRGKKTLLIELEDNDRAARLLGLPPVAQQKDAPRQVSPSLFVLAINGHAALDEYLQRLVPFKRVLRTVSESRPYQYFVAAAPGLKELMTMGKVWFEEHQQDPETAQLRWDVLIVDTPATGHSLQYLRMPQAASDTFSEGLVHRKAQEVVTFLSDPDRTAVNLVTTPEELPVSETLEAYQQLRDDLHLPVGVVFINRAHQTPYSRTTLERVRVKAHAPASERRLAEQVLACAQAEVALAEAQATPLQQLRQLSLPTVLLPFCFAQEFGLAQVEQLSQIMG